MSSIVPLLGTIGGTIIGGSAGGAPGAIIGGSLGGAFGSQLTNTAKGKGGSTSGPFGGTKAKTVGKQKVFPRLPMAMPHIFTGGYNLNASGTARDPRIQITDGGKLKAQDQAIRKAMWGQYNKQQGLANQYGNTISKLQGIRVPDRVSHLTNPFLQDQFREAMIAPYVAERDAAAREAERRGVFGPLSALATNPYNAEIARQEGLAENQATQWQLDVQQALSQRAALQMDQQSQVGALRTQQAAIQQHASEVLLDTMGEQQKVLLTAELKKLGISLDAYKVMVASQLEPKVAADYLKNEQGNPNMIGTTLQGLDGVVGGNDLGGWGPLGGWLGGLFGGGGTSTPIEGGYMDNYFGLGGSYGADPWG